MDKNFYLNKLRGVALCLSLTAVAAGMAVYPAEVSEAVKEAVLRCLNVLIPSLFAFMAVSAMLVESGSAAMLARPFRPVSRYIFKMPEQLFTVLLISTVAGYPVGIKTLSDMLDRGEIDAPTAEKAACFCYCGGPAFYSGAVGLAIFGSKQVGTLIFLSVLLSNLMLALLLCRFSKLRALEGKREPASGNLLVNGVLSAGRSMGAICMTVVFFSALMALLKAWGAFALIQRIFGLSDNGVTLLKAFIEITSLTELSGTPYGLLPLISAACSFGGVCIIMQLFALKSKKLHLFSFLKLRPFAAVLSALICKILQPYFINAAIAVNSYKPPLFKINNFAASICLIFMILLLNFKKSLVFSD